MISSASLLADGTLLYLRPFQELKRTASKLKQATKGKDFEIACSFICAVSDRDPEKARHRAAKTLAFYVAVGKYYSNFLAENGFKTEVEEINKEYKKSDVDGAAKCVSDRMLDSLAICGNGEECRESLSKFITTGITLPILQFNPIGDPETSFKEVLSTF
jgi:5,10-methylenetetrahydromethanopterin reductase